MKKGSLFSSILMAVIFLSMIPALGRLLTITYRGRIIGGNEFIVMPADIYLVFQVELGSSDMYPYTFVIDGAKTRVNVTSEKVWAEFDSGKLTSGDELLIDLNNNLTLIYPATFDDGLERDIFRLRGPGDLETVLNRYASPSEFLVTVEKDTNGNILTIDLNHHCPYGSKMELCLIVRNVEGTEPPYLQLVYAKDIKWLFP